MYTVAGKRGVGFAEIAFCTLCETKEQFDRTLVEIVTLVLADEVKDVEITQIDDEHGVVLHKLQLSQAF